MHTKKFKVKYLDIYTTFKVYLLMSIEHSCFYITTCITTLLPFLKRLNIYDNFAEGQF